jgi:hypothetical protein
MAGAAARRQAPRVGTWDACRPDVAAGGVVEPHTLLRSS